MEEWAASDGVETYSSVHACVNPGGSAKRHSEGPVPEALTHGTRHTDVLIDVQRGFKAAEDWFATDREVGVPGFVVMELVQDARNSACSTR